MTVKITKKLMLNFETYSVGIAGVSNVAPAYQRQRLVKQDRRGWEGGFDCKHINASFIGYLDTFSFVFVTKYVIV